MLFKRSPSHQKIRQIRIMLLIYKQTGLLYCSVQCQYFSNFTNDNNRHFSVALSPKVTIQKSAMINNRLVHKLKFRHNNHCDFELDAEWKLQK